MSDHHTPADTSGYSHGHQPSVLASHAARTAANSCAYFLDRLAPGKRVLDLGCGPGSITLDLAERVGPTGRVVGVDFSADAIAAARATAERRRDEVTEFLVGDLFNVDVAAGSFDIVHAHQVLQHVPNPVQALEAMANYCKPDGLIVARDADYGAMAWYPQLPGMDQWLETYCEGARATGGEPFAGRRLRAWAHAAGLEVEFAGSSTWTYATPEATAWWGGSQADRVQHSNFTRRAADQGLSLDQIDHIAADWRAWGQDPDAWFFLPHGEIIATKRTA
ncbi:methyltransferase domain-containing protein [Rothia kristinae]|uniref:methyltransferase domain-containing protein n=1 Tax=Rothia kristinae TaxID=37923 RepID=UPI00119EFF70|nr:methyltransferase domain-containing protein [Rothia kristinae]